MLRRVALAATVLSAACPSSPPKAPRAPDDTALRIQVARAEAQRAGGIATLEELAVHGEAHARALALRGLGRVGGEHAPALVRAALGDANPEVAAAARGALGVAASLDDLDPSTRAALGDALALAVAAELRAADGAAPGRGAPDKDSLDPQGRVGLLVAGIEALGRAGDARVQAQLAACLRDARAAVVEACALALGRHGRRKLPLSAEARAALVGIIDHPDPAVRYAAVYALGREHEPPADAAVATALARHVADADPEIRATAIAGLARRGAVAEARRPIEDSLRDRDWRVAVEAVRALAGEHGDDASRALVAAALPRRLAELARGHAAEAHVVIEGLRVLQPHAALPSVAASLAALDADASAATTVPALARGWIACLATAALERARPEPQLDALARCGGNDLPDHLRLPLLADLVSAGVGTPAFRRAALRRLLDDADVRVRAAGLGALVASWPGATDADRRTIAATLAAALGARDPVLAGAAVDAAGMLYEAIAAGAPAAGEDRTAAGAGAPASGGDPLRLALDAAVVARASTERDVELAASLYELIGKQTIAAGAAACRAGLSGAPVGARAAATCLRALGEPATLTPAAAVPPPVDVASVIGRVIRWHLVTTRGEIVIALQPDVAPWNVATVVALTRRGFYDGLELHRVVPDFVAQGGDPTGSGWGGPGFTTPAEPAVQADGPGFAAGGIGMADAGRDSAGSQWFVMHARAPHLDGRYTWIGRVIAGMEVADALLIGDRVVRATVEVVGSATPARDPASR